MSKEQGNEAFKQGDYQAALAFYSSALDVAPNDHTIYSNRSFTYAKLGNASSALADAEKCVQLKGDFAKGWLRKGQAHELRNEWRQAVEAYRSGLDIEPNMQQLKEAYQRADAAERRAGRPSTSSSSASSSSASSTTRSAQMQRTREKPSDLVEVDLPKLAFKFAKNNWVLVSLWVLGMLIMTIMPAPVQVSPAMEAEFNNLMEEAHTKYAAKISDAKEKAWAAQQDTNAAYGWFLNEHETAVYNERLERQKKLEAKLAFVVDKREQLERVAHSKVGLWSEYGMQAVKDKFWYMINEGTGFAKRSTMWDAFFVVLSGRSDEGLASFVMQMLLRFVMNFTIGMFGALVGFFWTLVGIVQSFNPDTGSAILFYCVAGLGALSMVATIVLGLYGTVGGTVYYVVKTAANAQRLEGAARRRNLPGNRGMGGQYGGGAHYSQYGGAGTHSYRRRPHFE